MDYNLGERLNFFKLKSFNYKSNTYFRKGNAEKKNKRSHYNP